jgi:hypothetical protein
MPVSFLIITRHCDFKNKVSFPTVKNFVIVLFYISHIYFGSSVNRGRGRCLRKKGKRSFPKAGMKVESPIVIHMFSGILDPLAAQYMSR